MDDTRTLSVQPPVWMPFVLLLAVVVGGLFYVHGKKVEVRDATPALITITGDGKAYAVPDIAELSFGVQIQRQSTAKQAMDMLAKDMEAVIAAVKKAGVDEKDIRTEGLSLQPAYDWNEGRQIARGFDASQSLRVKVRDMDSVSDVLAAAANGGANQVGGVNFVVDDPDTVQAQARQEAIDKAQEKAQMLAQQLGMHLGKVKNFSEGGGYTPPMPYGRGGVMMMEAKAMDVAAPPLPAGEQEVNIQVSITYELR